MATTLIAAPKPPPELKRAGRDLWTSIVSRYELEHHEEVLLHQACRIKDRLDELAKRIDKSFDARLLTEERHQEIAFTRLYASLRLPDSNGHRPQRRGAARGAYHHDRRNVE
jgi:hypothetical protein